MTTRADTVNERTRRISAPADPKTGQTQRPELPLAGLYPQQVVLRTPIGTIIENGVQVSAPGHMMAQRLQEDATAALTDDEALAGLTQHVKAFGPLIKVRAAISVPPSYMAIAGLVIPVPDDPDAEDLGSTVVPVMLLPGNYVTPMLKAPGAPFVDPTAQVSEGSSV